MQTRRHQCQSAKINTLSEMVWVYTLWIYKSELIIKCGISGRLCEVRTLGKLHFADLASLIFLILISFFAIKIGFLPPLQRTGNLVGKAANSLQQIIQSPKTPLHLISPLCVSDPFFLKARDPFYIISSSHLPRFTSRCSMQLNPSSLNPAFHLVLGDLSAEGSLKISISCTATNMA